MRFPLAIIPAAGQGTRMGGDRPKCLVEVAGEPLIRHVVRFWAPLADRLVVIARPEHRRAFTDALGSFCRVDAAEPEDSLPGAIARAWRKEGESDQFAVGLGDCLFDGVFDFPYDLCNGVGVMDCDGPMAQNYAVEVCNHYVKTVAEKPRLGLGAYFLSYQADAFLCLRSHITDVVAELVLDDHVSAVPFRGRYLNVNTPEDLKRWG